MAIKKSGGLGRGLSSILPDTKDLEVNNTVTAAISMIALEKIVANPYQPRKEFDKEALDELAQSIRQQGVITPVTVPINSSPENVARVQRRWQNSKKFPPMSAWLQTTR